MSNLKSEPVYLYMTLTPTEDEGVEVRMLGGALATVARANCIPQPVVIALDHPTCGPSRTLLEVLLPYYTPQFFKGRFGGPGPDPARAEIEVQLEKLVADRKTQTDDEPLAPTNKAKAHLLETANELEALQSALRRAPG